MKQSFVDELIERGTAVQEAVQNFLEIKGSIVDLSDIPDMVVDRCILTRNTLDVYITKLKAEGGT